MDGEACSLGYWDVFRYKHPDTGWLFRDFEVEAGTSVWVPFVFHPRADAPVGRCTMTMLFATNDPDHPYVRIRLAGNAI